MYTAWWLVCVVAGAIDFTVATCWAEFSPCREPRWRFVASGTVCTAVAGLIQVYGGIAW